MRTRAALTVLLLAGMTCPATARTAAAGGVANNDRQLCGHAPAKLSLSACTRLIDDKRETPEIRALALRNRGDQFQFAGNLDWAISDYTASLEMTGKGDRQTAEVHVSRGLAYAEKKDAARALIDYDEAVRLDPTLPRAYLGRATILMDRGDERGAIADLGTALRLAPSAETFKARGDAYLASGDRDGAIADYTQAIALDPKLASAFNNRGVAYLEQANCEKAIADFSAVIAIDPSEAPAWLDRGEARERNGDSAGALVDFDEALRLAPTTEEALRQRAFLRQTADQHEAAISDYTSLIALLPKDAAAYRGRGFSELSLRRFGAAIADFTMAIGIDPTDALAYRFRSQAEVAVDDMARARSDDDAALRLAAKLPGVSKVEH